MFVNMFDDMTKGLFLLDGSSMEYGAVFLFVLIAIAFSTVASLIPYFLSGFIYNEAKGSPYECGFEPLDKSNRPFDIKFYLIGVLFMIFDLEVIFLVPWSVSLKEIGPCGLLSGLMFLFVITLGFIYEWKKGALEWN